MKWGLVSHLGCTLQALCGLHDKPRPVAKLSSFLRPPPSKLWDSCSLARTNEWAEAWQAGLYLLFTDSDGWMDDGS